MNAHSISLFVLLKLILSLCLDAQSRIVTLEGELINGNIKSISDKGVVSLDEKEIPLDGLRTIFFNDGVNDGDDSIGKVVLICGSELAVSNIILFEEEFILSVNELGKIKVPIDAVRALRFGQLRRGSRFQKALLDWTETRELDTIFISGGAELKEVEGLIAVSYTHLTLPTNREV